MEFLFQNNRVTIESEKRFLLFDANTLQIDGLQVEVQGEYEKSGSLIYVEKENETMFMHITLEGYHIGYISEVISDISSHILDFYGDLDVLICPTAKSSLPVIEKVEPRLLVTYGDASYELTSHLGISDPPMSKYRLKESELYRENASNLFRLIFS